jgi:hypothetical protein
VVNVGTKLFCGASLVAVLSVGALAAEVLERGGDPWHFERGQGWRFEHPPGVWSPYYVWWWVNGQVVLLAAPAVHVVQFSSGIYELRGNGITIPYHWVWVRTSPVVAPPPPPSYPPPPPPPPAAPSASTFPSPPPAAPAPSR